MSVLSTFAATGLLSAAGPVPAPLPVAPPPRAVEQLFQAYPLRNAAAADVAQALTQYAPRTGRDAVFAADPASNAVLVRGSGAGHAEFARVIAAIDAPLPQHLVTTVIAEVPRSFLTDCGMRTAADQTPVFTLTERELRMLMVDFRNARDRQVLSRPQVQVCDNQTGFVQVGQDFPVVTGVTQVGGVPRHEVTYRPTGITMQVTPRLLPDGTTQIRAEVRHTVPVVAFGTITATAVATTTTTMETTWTTPAGATTVLAVPTISGGREVEVLIFITPHVVRTEK